MNELTNWLMLMMFRQEETEEIEETEETEESEEAEESEECLLFLGFLCFLGFFDFLFICILEDGTIYCTCTFHCTTMTFVTASSARKNFFSFLKLNKKPGQHITVTHQGIPKLVMMSFEEFEGWMETLEIMSDPKLVRDLRKAEKDMRAGVKGIPWEQVKRELAL